MNRFSPRQELAMVSVTVDHLLTLLRRKRWLPRP